MKPWIEELLKLQENDLRIRQLETRLEMIPIEIQRIDQDIEEGKAELKKKKEGGLSTGLEFKRVEGDILAQNNEIDRLQKQSVMIKKNDEYKVALEEGAVKFPGDKKICPALAKIYVAEGNELYKAGAAILGAANEKVNAGSLKTDDAAYTAEVDKAKVEFKAAVEVLEKAKALDATNANAQTLIDACKAVL